MRNQRIEIEELMPVSKIEDKTQIKYLRDLHINDESFPTKEPPNIKINNDIEIGYDDFKKALKKLKNIKTPGQDDISNELVKYGREMLVQKLTKLTNHNLKYCSIADEWRISSLLLLFKKVDKK